MLLPDDQSGLRSLDVLVHIKPMLPFDDFRSKQRFTGRGQGSKIEKVLVSFDCDLPRPPGLEFVDSLLPLSHDALAEATRRASPNALPRGQSKTCGNDARVFAAFNN
ncbi:hypothetical protein KBZ15_01145 [Cyanobium sp. BA20m-p-22]|uniref:hypothetical protein n=1 Tax=Cyanobium sp. BA20m-p-22 TaxID=2823704 RepID=UPI0020CCA625|nr:hypothetical protein [Cyanobium sp. BA20m-p-22]MCP9908523.1 hypothetical protein [Cyanobium sp. BA20m-p-22]